MGGLGELRKGFAAIPKDPQTITLLAFRAGRSVGHRVWFPMDQRAFLAENAGV